MLPELLPLDALAVHAFLHEHVPDGIHRVAPSAHVHHELVHAVDEPIDRGPPPPFPPGPPRAAFPLAPPPPHAPPGLVPGGGEPIDGGRRLSRLAAPAAG